MFFIDDLDRINPVFAVEILEIFTNIFDIENCIFVLAIDYEVVIKGLEPKFGPYSSKNEREFRSFFDKIIQLPFSMPVSSYEIGTFLSEALGKIGYLKGKDLDSNIKDVKNFATLTVGSNPRALKRLINILSLLSLISLEAIKDKDEDYEEEHENTKLNEIDSSFKVINFAIVCLQVTFPSLYSILESHPDYETWNDTLASQLNLPIVEDSYMKLLKDEEDWKKFLYRACQDSYSKSRFLNIIEFFNKLFEFTNNKEIFLNYLDSIFNLTSLTNTTSTIDNKLRVRGHNYDNFIYKGVVYSKKNQLVRKVIEHYIETHPNSTFLDLQTFFAPLSMKKPFITKDDLLKRMNRFKNTNYRALDPNGNIDESLALKIGGVLFFIRNGWSLFLKGRTQKGNLYEFIDFVNETMDEKIEIIFSE